MMEKSANETLLSISLSPSETLPWINVHHHLQNLPLPAGAPRSTCSARAAWRTGTEAPREAERLPSMIRASWCFTGCKRRWDPSSRITTKSTRRPPLKHIRLRAFSARSCSSEWLQDTTHLGRRCFSARHCSCDSLRGGLFDRVMTLARS